MLTELKKNEIYMWIYPPTAHGLKFRVVKILGSSYILEYVNRKYQIPKSCVVEISRNFVDNHILDILKVVRVA